MLLVLAVTITTFIVSDDSGDITRENVDQSLQATSLQATSPQAGP